MSSKTAHAPRPHHHHARHGGKLRRFLQKPKGILIVLLVALTAVASVHAGPALVAPGLLAAVATAFLVDGVLLRWKTGKWTFPDGGILTALIVAMILSQHEVWWVAAVTTAFGIVSKYVFRTRAANILNPAAAALLANYFVFHSGQSWWGALSESAWPLVGLLLAIGIYIADRVTRLTAALAFLGVYYVLFTVTAFIGDPASVAGIFRPPDLQAALFFALVMVTDPPTSPPRARDQITFGLVVAVIAYAIHHFAQGIYYLLVALLLANLGEAWRRSHARKAHGHGHAQHH
jgi:Na+-translocating ferredoxin:NAD+ oxidoreductase RnfD subunit